jgi:hypothetical protein
MVPGHLSGDTPVLAFLTECIYYPWKASKEWDVIQPLLDQLL